MTMLPSALRHLFAVLCFLISVFCPLFSGLATAAEITNISLKKSPAGDTVVIDSDGPLTYEVFDLKAPPRLVLNMPHALLKKNTEPLHDGRPGVNSVFPSGSADGVRVEIGMNRTLTYRIDEQGNRLLVHFLPAAGAKITARSGAILKDLDIRDRGTVTELTLRGDHMDASHDVFVTNHGRTMILDLWGAVSKLPRDHYAVASRWVSGVSVGQAAGRVRLVVDLLAGVGGHRIEAGSGRMVVRIGRVMAQRKAVAVQVQDVQFHPKDRTAQLVVRTDVANPVVNIYEKKGNVVMDFDNAALAPGQERSQDVSEFPGPVRQVDAYRLGKRVRIVARLRNKAGITTFQRGNVLTVSLVPEDIAATRQGAIAGGAPAYSGQKVSFDFKDIDIRNALKMIAEMSNLNIIMSDDVNGKLTMRLVDVPWDQALDIILSAQGLGKERSGNVLRIAPIQVLQAENALKLKARKVTENLEPLITEFVTLSFASATDVKTMLEGARTAGTTTAGTGGATAGAAAPAAGGQAGFGLLSPRGSILADVRSNTLIIHDTQTAVNNIKRLITRIDQPVKQVLIAARIVEATDDFTRELGVRWGGSFLSKSPNIGGGGVQGATNPADSGTAQTATGGRGFLVDLPATVGAGKGGAIGLTFGYLAGAVNLDLELSAAEADNMIKIVSNPRVVTTNFKKASINQGKDIPFQTSSANTGTNIEFRKADLGLEVTPQITADDRVLLHVVVTKDSPTSSEVAGNPILDTKKIETDIFMNNGETIVIGGIYTRDRERNTNGVPGLMRIPILGWLFKKKQHIDKKSELLIFITPKILQTNTGQTGMVRAN